LPLTLTLSPLGLRVPHKIMPAQTAPSPLRERAGVRGNIRLWWSFRSRYVPCYSVTTWPVNVPGWLSRHHPGDPGFRRKIAASRYLRLIPSGLSGTGGGNIPVKPALSAHPCASPRPTGNASAIYSRTEASLKALSYSEATLSLLLSNCWGTLSLWGDGRVRGVFRQSCTHPLPSDTPRRTPRE
ncbi:hypothetical protein AI2796V1_3079, partial [Enterobacter cloacae]